MPSPTETSTATLATPRAFRLTVRRRLALTYGGLVILAGVVIIGVVYVVIGVVPSFAFASQDVVPVREAVLESAPPLASDGGVPPARTIDPGLIALPDGHPGPVVSSRGDIQRLILVVAAVVLVLLALGGAWLGWWLAGRMLRPLRSVSDAAHRAAAGDLHHRVGLVGPEDELKALADTFDGMLAELERSFTAQRRFASNVSHELRTPLAVTRAMLDVAIAGKRTPSVATLERLRDANERSIRTVESLLDLAEIESGTIENAPVRMDVVAKRVLQEVSGEAAQMSITVDDQAEPTSVHGDPHLLHQLVENLVHNAVRHNSTRGCLRVSTRETDDGALIEVENSGTVLDPDDIPSLLEPFARGEGRTNGRGRGLGLSIVSLIAERHGAVFSIDARASGGVRARVLFLPHKD